MLIPKGEDRLNVFEFEFRHKVINNLFIKITYNGDENYKELVVWNMGSIDTADLLFGGNKYEQSKKNKEIIGRHVDGMKAAALTCLKNDTFYRIITSGEESNFTIEKCPGFERKGEPEPEKCMYVTRKNLDREDIKKYENKVYVIIGNIDQKTWVESIDNFLWLTQKEMGKVTVNEKGERIGEILLGKDFCGKNYVKEIFVDNITGEFWLNIDVDLDRDRNWIPVLAKRNEIACKLIANVLNNLKEANDESNKYDLKYINNTQVFTHKTRELLREFPKRIYNSFRSANQITEKLYENMKRIVKLQLYYLMNWRKIHNG